jgi:hypothetical protein
MAINLMGLVSGFAKGPLSVLMMSERKKRQLLLIASSLLLSIK